MDNAEQSPRGPTRGSFDAASLLGIHDPQQISCKTAMLPMSDFQTTSLHNSSSGLSPEKEFGTGKNEKVTNNSIQPAVLPVLPVPVNSAPKSASQKSEVIKETNANSTATTSTSSSQKASTAKRKRTPKEPKATERTKNGKRTRIVGSRNKSHAEKKQKEKTAKTLSSDSESHMMESSCSSSGASSSGGVSSSGSSDSTDEEEREKQQQELARLKKQQKELRRKVQKLKQASHESSQQKSDSHSKKTTAKSVPSPRSVNNAKKTTAPSPAHASSTLSSPKTATLKPKLNLCNEEDANMSVPLDLCVKKQEPTFEVSNSSFLSSFTSPINTVKKQLLSSPFSQQTSVTNSTSSATTTKLPATTPRRRGRKPKYIVPSSIAPEMAHQLKQNSIRDLSNMLLPQKLLPAPPSSIRNADHSQLKKNINSHSLSKPSLVNTNDIANPISIPKKNFTLDSLLAESNGTVEAEKVDIAATSSLFSKNSRSRERLRYSNRIKKLEEQTQDFEKFGKLESSSATDSDPENDHSDSEESISGNISASAGHKRTYDEDGEESSGKRRRVIPDEREIQIPLEHGWRRETKIRCFSRAGVRGEVIYYTPCGKKLRSYPEVVRYLIKNGITDISRDNFTFSTKVNVGDFLEAAAVGEEYVLLSEQEVVARINEVRTRKGRLGVQNRRSAHQRMAEHEEQQRQWEQKQIQHQFEQQEYLRQARESKMLRQLQREQALMAARNERKIKAEEVRRQKEQQRLMKQQERFERNEQLRIEREIRAQQALEEQEIKRQQAAFLREQEMQKRREMLLMVDLERERRRQHMMLVRALETRKKQEERERKKEEILYEKRINREKKMEQRRIELDYLRELKKPVEDMMLKDNMPLPTYNRIPGVKLAGKEFSDLLMVFEFLHNFGETLGFDPDSLPSLNVMQMAVLNMDEKVEEELLSVIHHLLVCAIEDPGVPHTSESSTVLGQNLKDADITNNNVSEVLRLYFTAQDKRSPLCQLLQAKPFLSLNATQKTEILAHICNDLLGSRVLMRKIDSNIENVNVLRKDKWLIEGDLRRLKTVQQRRLLKEKQLNYEESKQSLVNNSLPNEANPSQTPTKDSNSTPDANSEAKDSAVECEKEKLDDLDNDNESGNESDDTQAHGLASDGEDEDLQLSNEELTKKVEKLTKQLTSYSNKLTKALHTIRAVTFGQDRYHRRYWVLPKCGGIFIESMESSELPEQREKTLAAALESDECLKEKLDGDMEVKKEGDVSTDEKDVIHSFDDKNMLSTTQLTSFSSQEEPSLQLIPTPEVLSTAVLPKDCHTAVIVKKEVEHFDQEKIEDKIAEDVETVPKKETSDLSETAESKEPQPSVDDSKKQSPERTSEDGEHKRPDSPLELHQRKETEPKVSESKMLKDNHKSDEKLSADDVPDKKAEKKPDVNIFMPKFCDSSLGLDSCSPLVNHSMHNGSDRKQPPNLSIPGNQNWLLHSPFFASLLAGNMLFNGPMVPGGREANGTYFNLPKTETNNPFGPFLGLPPGMLSPEQIFKSLNDKSSNQKPWFSILPRMPCDEDSLPKSQQLKTPFTSPVYTPPNPFLHNSSLNSSKLSSPGPHSTPSTLPNTPVGRPLSNLQMEILNGMPPGFFLHPFLPHQFGPSPAYQNNMPASCSSPSPFTPTLSHSSPMTDFTLNLGRPPASSTPSSIPTPSATPGPNSQGCATPTFRDSPTPSIKRLMMEKITQEYDRPKPIPLEFQKGWWRITDSSQVKDLVNALHHRGIREKMLQKHLQKHFNYACSSCSQGQDQDANFEITDMDRKISELPGGAPLPEGDEVWSHDVALRVDMAILEQIENLEEKIDGASMQVKGWKPPAKLSTESLSKFIPACELYLQVKCDIADSPKEKTPKRSSKKNSRKRRSEAAKRRALEAESAEAALEAKAEDADTEDKQDDATSEAAKEADEKEKEKSNEEDADKEAEDILMPPPGKVNPIEEAKKRLLMVESAIERRYLKPPLGFSSNDLSRSALTGGTNSQQSVESSEEEAAVPVGLIKWRNSVQSCRSSCQLAMCLNYLENFTAWDKSIMRASCQFCHSGENEEMLLLCDGCDKGYHTYCFKPKMEKIPEGDWYCYECLNKATGDNVCVICGKKGKLIDCSACPKCFHLTCLDPPLSKMPKGRWFCSGCSNMRPKKSCKKSVPFNKDKDKEVKESPNSKKSEGPSQPSKNKCVDKKDRKEKARNQAVEDLSSCSLVVEEMEKHDDSWPFLSPVNTKQFPTYRKVIKKPMDLATVRSKLESNQYKCREDFATDVRLIFDNCETFNEDDSPVGQAGHTMRAFFDARWSELCNT